MLATSLPDARGEATPAIQPATGWIWAAARRIGTRHLAQGGRCEDAADGATRPDGALALALADGVSGGACGDVAARALVGHVLDTPGLEQVRDWMQEEAEAGVRAALDRHTQAAGAATFAAAWIAPDGRGLYTRVGDCRAHLWQADADGRIDLRPLLPDQTLAYMGYVPPNHVKAGNPAHMVGNGNMGPLEWLEFTVPAGGGLLLCSDGLHAVVPAAELAARLQALPHPASAAELETLCETLIDLAQALGGEDDVSVLLAQRQYPQGAPVP